MLTVVTFTEAVEFGANWPLPVTGATLSARIAVALTFTVFTAIGLIGRWSRARRGRGGLQDRDCGWCGSRLDPGIGIAPAARSASAR